MTTPLEQAQGYSGGGGIADYSIRASTGLLWWWGYCRLKHRVTLVVGVLQTTPLEQAQGYAGGEGIGDYSIRASTGLLWWWGYCRLH